MVPGVYDVQHVDITLDEVFTNTAPTDAYRGAGRPEATHLIERLVDRAGRRARPRSGRAAAAQLRHRVPVHHGHRASSYDSGDYGKALDKALEMSDYAGFEARRAEAAARGNYRGIGLSTWVEICGLAPSAVTKAIGIGAGGWESSIVRMHPTGSVTVITGSSAHGQGHETSWSQIVESELGIPFDQVEVVHGDTGQSPVRPRHLRLALAGGRRHGAAADLREGARQGAPDRRAPARVLGRRSRVGARASGRSRARPSAPRRSRSWPTPPGPATRCPPASSRTSRRRRSTTRRTSRSRSARTSPRSRSTARPARSSIERYTRGRRLRQRDQPDDRRGPGARRHRAVDRAGALRGDGLRRERADPHGHARRLHDPVGGRAAAHGHRRAPSRRRPPIRSGSRASARRARSRPPRASSTRRWTRSRDSASGTSTCRCSRGACGRPSRQAKAGN